MSLLPNYLLAEIPDEKNDYGTIYTVPLKICIFEREGEVITAWILRHKKEVLQLITCYVNI
jgi:hypothetical protein